MIAEFEQLGMATESRDVLDALASSGLFAEFVQNSDDAVICIDAYHRIATWNAGAQQIYGYSAAEIIGQSAEIFAPAGKELEFVELLQLALSGGLRESFESERLHKNGSRIYVRSRYFPLRSPEGTILGVLVHAHDITPRIVAESALFQSERTLKALLNALPEAAVLCDVNGTVLALNATAAQYINSTEDSIIGSNAFTVPSGEHADLRRGNAEQIKLTKQPLETTTEYNGTWRRTRIYPVLDAEGEVIRFAIYSMDITAQSRAEAQQKITQQRLAILLEHLPKVVYYETGGGREYISDNLVNLLGFSPEQFTADRTIFPALIHPEDGPLMHERLVAWHAAGEPGPLRMEFRCRNAAGNYIWVEDLMVEVRPEAGRKYMSGILMDITARKTAEEELERSQAKLTRAQELAHVGHWEYNLETDHLECSDELLRLFHRPASEMRTLAHFISSLHPDDVERVRAVNAHIKTVDKQYDIQHRIVRPTGEVRYVRAIGRRVWVDGEPTNTMIGTGQDITDVRHADALLRKSELQAAELAALHTTAATYAHEINNPLTGMIGLLQMLLDEGGDAEKLQMLGDALAAARRIQEVTSKLQSITVPEYRRYTDGSRIFDLRD